MEDFIKYGVSKPFIKRKKDIKEISIAELFKNPLIHREIHGEKVYTPLDPNRLWGI